MLLNMIVICALNISFKVSSISFFQRILEMKEMIACNGQIKVILDWSL